MRARHCWHVLPDLEVVVTIDRESHELDGVESCCHCGARRAYRVEFVPAAPGHGRAFEVRRPIRYVDHSVPDGPCGP